MAEGGCLCGAVRYRLDGPPLQTDYCHCRLCRRAAGAPVVAWSRWPAGRFAWSQGEPKSFASSARGERWSCPRCGTPLAFRDPGDPTFVDATLASLDDPAAFRGATPGRRAASRGWRSGTRCRATPARNRMPGTAGHSLVRRP